MTQIEIQAGPELDAEIARRVFGVKAWVGGNSFGRLADARTDQSEMFPSGWLPRFSDDIACAWLVLETMRERIPGCGVSVSMFRGDTEWTCEIWNLDGCTKSVADTVPLAICRAALVRLERP